MSTGSHFPGFQNRLIRIPINTIGRTLHAAGFGWQKSRTWCETGVVVRKRKHDGLVAVADPDAAAKKGLIERACTLGAALRPGGLVRGRGRPLQGGAAAGRQLAPCQRPSNIGAPRRSELRATDDQAA